jgi:CubicO group peptidase (beta-lactamase class C family)
MNPSRRAFALGLASLPAVGLTTFPKPVLGGSPQAQPASLTEAAEAARERFGLPALAVLCARGNEVLENVAVGVRARGDVTPVSTQDRWHIGSCAKAMTTTLIARLIEKGLIDWDTPMFDALPGLGAAMDPVAAGITLYQLMTMMSGLPENPTEVAGGRGASMLSGTGGLVRQLRAIEALAPTDPERRRLIAERILARTPRQAPGARFGYSNTNYILLGAIAEAVGGQSLETLFEQEVFAPLGVRSVGYGAPGQAGSLDQPRGHEARRAGAAVEPDNASADLPAFMRPAGGLHITLADWLRFAADQLAGERDQGRLLSRDTYVRLHTVAPGNTQPYACGWGSVTHGGRRMLTHTGNNTLWTATLRAYPASGHVFLYASNDGRVREATQAFDQLRTAVEARYPEF